MGVITVILYALVVLAGLLLTGLILIQPSKSGGFGAVFGGVGESVFGARAGSHLTKATVVMTVIFFVLALALAAIIGHNRSSKMSADIEKFAQKQNAAAPAAEAKTPEAAAPAAETKAPEAK